MHGERSAKGRESVRKGRAFEDQVAHLYHLLGYSVEQNIEICQKKVDLLASISVPGGPHTHRIIVECKYEKTNRAQNQRVMELKALLDMARKLGVADSAEIITRKPWSDQAKGFALEAGIQLCTFEEKLRSLLDFSDYIQRIIYDYEHYGEFFGPNGQPTRKPIIDLMAQADLYHTYIPLNCRVARHSGMARTVRLDEFLESWLADPQRNHLSILGDFGAGKSSLCLHLTYELAKKHLDDPANTRIPLFVSLRDYAKAVDLQQLVTDLLVNKYGIYISNYTVFQRFLEAGRLVMIFDGFDEMATKTDRALTVRNFEELMKVVVAGSKTILTCRTHYFTDQRHVDAILRSREDNELLQAVRNRPNFEIVELKELTQEQIQELIRRHRPMDWQKVWRLIKRTYHLEDLARRPLLLDMIVKTVPQLREMEEVNIAYLYDAYTRLWIEHEYWRAYMTPDGKRAFMEMLALRLWESGESAISYRDLRKPIQEHFREQVITRNDFDHYDHDTRTCSFLNRDQEGNYSFMHRSFAEFFVANRLTRDLPARTYIHWGQKPITHEILHFLLCCDIPAEELWSLIEYTRKKVPEEVGYSGGNAATLLHHLQESFQGRDLASTVLMGADLRGADLRATDLRAAVLRGSDLRNCALERADLGETDLTEAILFQKATVRSVSCCAVHNIVACGGVRQEHEGFIRVWDLDSFQCTFETSTYSVFSICFSWDDKYLACGGQQGLRGFITVWDTKTWEQIMSVETSTFISRIHWVPQADLFIACEGSGQEGNIHVWNAREGKCLFTYGGHKIGVCSAVPIPPGDHVLSLDVSGQVRVWTWLDQLKDNLAEVRIMGGRGSWRREIAVDLLGSEAVVPTDTGLALFDIPRGLKRRRDLEKSGGVFTDITFSPDGNYIVGCSDVQIRVWKRADGSLCRQIEAHEDAVLALSFSVAGDSILVSGGRDGSLRIWDTSSWQQKDILDQNVRCRDMRIGGAKGLEVMAPYGGKTLREWLIERGARED